VEREKERTHAPGRKKRRKGEGRRRRRIRGCLTLLA
jgi:hypothetical protein